MALVDATPEDIPAIMAIERSRTVALRFGEAVRTSRLCVRAGDLSMEAKTVGVAEFRTKCLRLIDEINRDRQPVIITKRGKPVALLTPIQLPEHLTIIGALNGTGAYADDPSAPATDPADWTANA